LKCLNLVETRKKDIDRYHWYNNFEYSII
jgi:hypothetical protein